MKKNNLVLKILLIMSFVILVCSSLVMFKTPTDKLNINGTTRLKSGDVIKQQHHFEVYSLKQLIFREATFGETVEKADFDISLYDDKENLLVTKNYVLENFPDGRFISFPTNNINLNGDYYIEIKVNELSKNANFNMYTTTSYDEIDSYTHNNKEIKGLNIGFIISGYQKTYFYTWIIMIIFLVLSVIFLIKNNIKNEKLLKFLSSKLSFGIFIIAALIFSILFFYGFKANSMTLKRSLAIIFSSIFAFLILFYIIANIRKKDIKVEKIFLLLAIPIGFMYTIYIMPFEVSDTQAHYLSAYQPIVSNFNGNSNLKAPENVTSKFYNRLKTYEEYFDLINEEYNYDKLGEIESDPYNFIEYFPTTAGLYMGKIMNLSPYIGTYIAKFFNLLLFIVLGYFIIKILPFAKFVMLVYLLNPIFLQQATSISVDSVINIFSMLFIAYIMKLKVDKDDIKYKDIGILGIALLFSSIQKLVYIALGLLVLMLFKKLKKMGIKKWLFALVVASVVIGLTLLWYFSYSASISNISEGILTSAKYTSQDPIRTFYILLNSFMHNYDHHVSQAFGLFLGWTDISIPHTFHYLYIIALFLAILTEENKIKDVFKKFDTFIIILSVIIICILVNYALYSGWTYIGKNIIDGVQGRYYIPAFIPLLILLYDKIKIKIEPDKTKNYIVLMLITVNVVAMITVLLKY